MKLTPFDDYVQVTAVSGGANTVKLPGKNELISNVASTNPCTGGQWLRMRRISNDRQQLILIAPRRKRKKVGWTLNDAVSSLNWHSWRSALYRGNWNNTNILPVLANAETILYAQPNPEGTAPAFGSSKIHNGYMYGTEYNGNMDNRLIRISLTDGLKTYATWSGISMYRHPDDFLITEEGGTLYAYIIFPWGDDFYLAKYNLDTMARVYLVSEVLFNTNRYNHRRLIEDSSYIYVFFYDGAFEKFEYIRKYNKSTGAFVSYAAIAWPSFDYQTNNYSYLCYASEIRSSIDCRVGNGVAFPTLANQGSSAIIYEIPAFNLDGTLKWNYKPTSKTLTKQWFSYVLEWYCSTITSEGCYFDLTYNTTNTLYNFGSAVNGDKQIRSTLIACNDTYAVALVEETTVKKNTTYKSYDDWQQTVWKETPFPLSTYAERYVEDGQGAPGNTTAHFEWMLSTECFPAFDSLAFDEDYLNFSWIDRKEVFLRVLNVNTGEVVSEYGFSSSEADTGGSDDLVVSRWDLITGIRVCSSTQFVGRDKETAESYSGPDYREMMGLEDDEYPHNAVTVRVLDFWVPIFDDESPFSYYWCGGYAPSGIGCLIEYDDLGDAEQCYQLGVQSAGPYITTPTGPGTWYYKCVAVKHPTADVTFHTSKYIPTKYDFTKTLMTDTRLFVAPSGANGRLGCFTITSPATLNWSLDVGPGSELLHMCCNNSRVYYFRGTVRTNCTLYEINIVTGAILTTKTGVSVCSNSDGYFEPMIIDKKLVLTDQKKLSYIGQ